MKNGQGFIFGRANVCCKIGIFFSHPLVLSSHLFSQFEFLHFGFSTRLGGVSAEPFGMNLSFSVGDDEKSVQRNREIFFGDLQIAVQNVAFTRQIHSNTILHVSTSGAYEQCDALVTNKPNLYLAITTADCVPLFLFDAKEHVVAAIHSGWRGCVNGILVKTIERLQKDFSTQPSNLIAYIGPAAGKCCYEVEHDVASQFEKQYVEQKSETKFLLNLQLFLKDTLTKTGVPEKNIEVIDACTIHQADIFHSYRRDGNRSGRMMGVIGMEG